ncbi:MAG: hypothetical protein J2P44_08210 [Candidatus Dormibacteraeota bacterium]|nr:hypothetical protein [Candidatus Dormibacteraeota bacterium]
MSGTSARDQPLTSMRDVLDNTAVAADGRRLARVGDVRARWDEDGHLRLEALVFGPQTLAARVWRRLGPPARALLRDRFDCAVPLSEVREIGGEIHLRGPSGRYPVGRIERSRLARIVRLLAGPRW